MRANILFLIAACASGGKPFDQMTAEEHRAAAAREHELADDEFEKITGDNIVPPDMGPTDVYGSFYAFPYEWYGYEIGDPEMYTAWPRVSDPDEKHSDRAAKHRARALRHEAAAAALEGRPDPRPLPPPAEPLIPPDPQT